MKIPYSWLKELVDVPVTPSVLADGLASVGLEVEALDNFSVPKGIVVAEVLTKEKHPNADRLSLCTVNTGSGEPLQVVCGAPNVAAGMRVALATVGCDLGEGFVVKKAKIRKVESFGMLCSERELGISDEHEGIMSLPTDWEIGAPLSNYYPDETVLTVELTPNRGDCLSVLGVAREVAAKYEIPLKTPGLEPKESAGTISDDITIEIENPEACPRYIGRALKGVTIQESPSWLKQRLTSCGIRPISNVVDVTNYILLLFGQPMHAFDYTKIAGKKIIVKNATENQKFTTLDSVERTLCADDLLICDAERAVALAGVMGGANTEITTGTKDVFLECAYFNPVGVRKTAKRLDLSSDSSYRFERGVDHGAGLTLAINTAAELIRDLAGGEIVSGMADTQAMELKKPRIPLRPAQANRLLGVDIPKEQMIKSLAALQIRLIEDKGDSLIFEAPTFRHDLFIEVDLIEEVGRMYGYDNIQANESSSISISASQNPVRNTVGTIRKALAYMGLHETVTNNMTSEKKRELLTPDSAPVVLLNPLSPDMAQMRTTLAASLLDVTSHNLKRRNADNRYFEISRTFESLGTEKLPRERDVVSILIEGNFTPSSWHGKAQAVDFFVLKGMLQALAVHCGLGEFTFAPTDTKGCYTNERARITLGDAVQGTCGKIREDICNKWDINTPVYFAELDVTGLLSKPLPNPLYAGLQKYPPVERDFCFVMAEDKLSSEIHEEIAGLSELVENVVAFDVYKGEKLEAGKKSIAFSVRLRAQDRTLTDVEAEKVSEKIVSTMAKKHEAVLRA